MLKKIAVALVAAGGLLVAAAPAHAGGRVSLSLGVGLPGIGIGYAAPAYYGPPPVAPSVAPSVVYAPAPVTYAPTVVPAYGPAYVSTPYYGPRYYGPGYYGSAYYGSAYYGPRVVYRPGPYYHGYRGHGGWGR